MTAETLTWILQESAFGKADFERLVRSIERRGARLETVRLVPFVHEVVGPVPRIHGACITYGSSGLLKLARRLGWLPAGWDGPSFDIDVAAEKLGTLSLNAGGRITTWSNAAEAATEMGLSKVFLRPISEEKEFPGQVLSLNELETWVKQLADCGYLDGGDNAAMVSQVRQLGREWRVFIVDGELVTASQYANAGRVDQQSGAPDAVCDFVRRAIAVYSPAPCFVVDVAEVVDPSGSLEMKVVEFNSINSAGFYQCDVDRIVSRLGSFLARRAAASPST